jgi:hypothetical protein
MTTRKPDDFSATAAQILAVLAPETPFAEAIIRRQAERLGLSVNALALTDLPRIVPLIIAASQAFVDVSVLASLKQLAK